MNYYWCVDHNRVETDENKCPALNLLGPYKSQAEARGAIERIKEREARIQAEDDAWTGDR